MAARGNCSFAQKVRRLSSLIGMLTDRFGFQAFLAQTAGYNGIIIYNSDEDPDEMGSDTTYGPKVIVPAFMVGQACGIALIEQYSFSQG